jgi:hypothetical protein
MQVVPPLTLEHVTLFPAAVAAAPVANVMLEMSVAE